LETVTVYPFQPRNDVAGATAELGRLIQKHHVELIAIGNGTASRETDSLAAEVITALPGHKPIKVVVSEAGASVYSASAKAAAEMPNLVVEDAVNAVGIDLNTASASLLSRVSGLARRSPTRSSSTGIKKARSIAGVTF
jgi:uncharacterized protein